jgi:hypothetical protein
MWCHYCEKKTTTQLIAEQLSNSNIRKRLASSYSWIRKTKNSAFFFEEINALKRQLKPEKTAGRKKMKTESLLSTALSKVT